MPNAAVVFNPTKVEREDLAEVIDPAAAAAGWGESVWLETAEDDPGTGMAKEAVERGCDVVIAVGGDGTIRAVSEGLRNSGVPLALCPQGTGNLLARNLDLTLDNLEESVDAAFNGVPRKVDLGIATWSRPQGGHQEERAFVVMAGMGLDAEIMSSTDEDLKDKVGMLAYVKSGAEALTKSHRMRLIFRLDNEKPRRAKVHTVIVGNCGSIGNNVLLLPDAAVDDGLLDVVAARPQGVWGWVRVGWKVLVDNAILRRTGSDVVRRTRDRDRQLSYQQCRTLELTFRDPHEIELDGDHFGEILAVRMSVEPDALIVQMPAGWTRDPDRPAVAEEHQQTLSDVTEPESGPSDLDPAEQAAAAAEAAELNKNWD
ncbi:diacylglycerol/lipid kinase family protein [Granulicoccus sp. GXG6511]|uniref:diacylglycerol/lipid kinase family protein n=1 Tax=Granulicoccus sp. GXG6511 TaxID=3381351 RepID=UPI003D7CD5B1